MALENQTMQRGIQGVVKGTANFATTDATGDLDTGGLLVVESVLLTWMGSHNTDETPYVAEAMDAFKRINVPADGKISIGRVGTKTSALAFSYQLSGY